MFDLNTSASGAAGNGLISEWHVVEGGKFAAFVSTSSNLVAGDTNGAADVFLRNLETGEVTLVSKSAAGVQGNGASGGLDVSADGTKLLFHSDASNLVAGDTNGVRDVFVRDIATGKVTLVSTSASGKAGNGASEDGAFSPDGRSVAFRSAATNLAPNDGNGSVDAFLKTLGTGAVLPLSYLYEDGAVTSVSATGKPVFSPNGGIVSFGPYAYALDTDGLVLLDVTRNLAKEDLNRVSISKGDGSALEYAGFPYKTSETGIGSMLKIGLDYDRDGDFKATVTGLKNDTAVTTLTFDVKVRSHAGSQNFKGDSNGEVVVLSSRDDKADGAAGDDVLIGAAGDDLLNGGLGADRLIGGTGNDTLIIDDSGDQIFEAVGGGNDKVLSSVSYALAAGQEIEALQLLSSTNRSSLNLTGNEFGQSLVGNNGANTLNGGDGADTMNGRGGSDLYFVDNAGDRVIEAVGGGGDKVLSVVSYALAAGQEVEALQLLSSTGRSALHLTGNEFGQTLVGNNGANTLNGGLGNDVLIGRGGSDTFLFATALGAGNIDRIADFAPEDTIRLSKSVFAALGIGELAESAFKDIGKGGKVDASDRIYYDSRNGNLFYDADGSGKGAAVKFAVLDNKAALTHDDLFVV